MQLKDGTPTGAGAFLLPMACLSPWLIVNVLGSAVTIPAKLEGLASTLIGLPSHLFTPITNVLGQLPPGVPGRDEALHGIADGFHMSGEVAVITCFTAAAVLVGWIDDCLTIQSRQGAGPRGLPASIQLIIQLVFALDLAAAVSMLFPQAIMHLAILPSAAVAMPKWMYCALCAFTYISMVNGVNLTDGLDGLAASCTALVFSTMAVLLAASHAQVAMVRVLLLYVHTCQQEFVKRCPSRGFDFKL